MTQTIALFIALIFVALSLWHVYMAARPQRGIAAAVPSADGKPLFRPSRAATLGVALGLLLCAALVVAMGGLVSVGLSSVALAWFSYALSVVLFLRAVGDFKYVGLFKRVRDSRFAQLDSFFYSPLCLLLAAGVAWVASQRA